jgi:hypothetical protein
MAVDSETNSRSLSQKIPWALALKTETVGVSLEADREHENYAKVVGL